MKESQSPKDSEARHTPGPWNAQGFRVREAHRDFSHGIWKEGVRLALVNCRPLRNRSEEEANARLIAAAPDLLAALRLACLVMAKGNGLSYQDRREAHEACINAIAKAEGRS